MSQVITCHTVEHEYLIQKLRVLEAFAGREAERRAPLARGCRAALVTCTVLVARDEAARSSLPVAVAWDEAFLALMDAAQCFDPGRGVPFDGYARWWIRMHLNRAAIAAVTARSTGSDRPPARSCATPPRR